MKADGETSASVRLRVRPLPEGHNFRELTLADVPVQDESRTLRIIRQLRREREEPTTVRVGCYCGKFVLHVWPGQFRFDLVLQNEIFKRKFLPQRLVVTLVRLPRSAGSEMVF